MVSCQAVRDRFPWSSASSRIATVALATKPVSNHVLGICQSGFIAAVISGPTMKLRRKRASKICQAGALGVCHRYGWRKAPSGTPCSSATRWRTAVPARFTTQDPGNDFSIIASRGVGSSGTHRVVVHHASFIKARLGAPGLQVPPAAHHPSLAVITGAPCCVGGLPADTVRAGPGFSRKPPAPKHHRLFGARMRVQLPPLLHY